MGYSFAFIGSRALSAAVDLDLFTHIARGAVDAAALQQATGASERGLRRLVGALQGMGLVTEEGGRLSLAPDAATFLDKNSPAYLGGLVVHQNAEMWSRWNELPEVVRKGSLPFPSVEGDEDDGAFFARFVDSLFNLNYPAAQAVAAQLPAEARSAVDIGAGSGVWSLALAQRLPELRVTAVDRQQVLDRVTRVFAERLGVADRYQYVAGNFRSAQLGTHDVAFLGHILHSEGVARSRTLLRRLYEALNPGGTLVVAEMVVQGDLLFPQLFGLNMLLNTDEGDVFSGPELETMAREAGFSETRWLQAPSPSPVMLARK